MRRCLNSLLVGVLTFSLSVDAARACGHLRFRRCVPAPRCVPTVIVVGGACGCDGAPLPHVVAGCEEIPCGTPVDCCGGVVVSTPVAPQADSVVAPVPTVVAPAPAVAAPEPAAPQPTLSVVPDLEPVAPASATEPVPAPAEPDTAPSPQAEPEMDTIAAPDAGAAEPPADVPADTGAPEMVEPEGVAAEPSIPDVAGDAQEPEMEEEAPQPTPDAREPVVEEPPPPAPKEPNPFDEPDTAAAEPQRRWIDATASYAVVGRLVDVRGDEVDILRADGRLVTVPVVRLSDFDRDYVGAAGPRIAATRHRGPLPTDTAGR